MNKLNSIVLIVITLTTLNVFAQNFEGTITYKIEMKNPTPEKVTDSVWQENLKKQFGEKGYMIQKYYYKENKYLSEIDAGEEKGFQVFNPKDGLLYSWQKNTTEAITVDSKKYMDKITEIEVLDKKEVILGLECKSIRIKSQLGEMILWYNNDKLKMNKDFYKGHKYGHWEEILKQIGCLPLKIQSNSFFAKMTQTAIEFNEEKINDEKFNLPEFEKITANPMN